MVEVGANAGSVTAVGSQLWVAHYTNRPEHAWLTRVDPFTAIVVGRLQPPHLCCEVAGAAGRIWAVDPRGAVLAIDPDGGGVVSSTPVAIDPNVHVGLVGDERALWLSSDTTALLRVDPATARVAASIDVGGGIPMAIAHDLVWGASPHHVWAVDPASNEIRVRLPIENTIETLNLAVTENALWLGARRPGYVGVVIRFDLATGRATGEAAVSLPARLLFAFGSVWVVDWDSNTLLRFDDAPSSIG
jgi:streptogramin lyase